MTAKVGLTVTGWYIRDGLLLDHAFKPYRIDNRSILHSRVCRDAGESRQATDCNV